MTIVEALRVRRHGFQKMAKTPEGEEFIAWLLNECRSWSTNPEDIIPERVALGNQVLHELGVIHAETDLIDVVRGLLSAANDRDLDILEREGASED